VPARVERLLGVPDERACDRCSIPHLDIISPQLHRQCSVPLCVLPQSEFGLVYGEPGQDGCVVRVYAKLLVMEADDLPVGVLRVSEPV
jgi:hypothetical protein